jgi:hypothetical protein
MWMKTLLFLNFPILFEFWFNNQMCLEFIFNQKGQFASFWVLKIKSVLFLKNTLEIAIEITQIFFYFSITQIEWGLGLCMCTQLRRKVEMNKCDLTVDNLETEVLSIILTREQLINKLGLSCAKLRKSWKRCSVSIVFSILHRLMGMKIVWLWEDGLSLSIVRCEEKTLWQVNALTGFWKKFQQLIVRSGWTSEA